MLNPKTHRKYERAASMKFCDILHKGSWGHWAKCARENGDVFLVNKHTGECYKKENGQYINGEFRIFTKKLNPLSLLKLWDGMKFSDYLKIRCLEH